MKREKINYDFSKMKELFQRTEHLNYFALERMETVLYLLRDKEKYHCPAHCNKCCYGSILMSYTEFTFIMLYIQQNWAAEKTGDLFQERVGLLQNEESLLCPFLQEDANSRHCLIYPARPLICRVFGTTASPCEQPVTSSHLEDELFYQAYDLLYYSSNRLIALDLDPEWSVYEAPFALWCLADDGPESRSFLRSFIEESGDSFRAVLYDQKEKTFFYYSGGKKEILQT